MQLFGIVGAGGFGREVIPLAKGMLAKLFPAEHYELVFVQENMNEVQTINNYSVMSLTDFLAKPALKKFFNIAIAQYDIRKRLAEMLLAEGVTPFNIHAANYVELDNNKIAAGAIFCPFTTVTSNAKIGKFFHANIYSYIAHDCVIGDYVTFAPNVHCNGGVIIEDHVYVGTGAIIRQSTKEKPIVIGKGATIGMGAVVTKSVLPTETVVGNPARKFPA